MPCYSTVTKTKMTDEGRLADALAALGYDVIRGTNVVTGRLDGRDAIQFSRDSAGVAFGTPETDAARINAVQRRYAEIGVREWARRRGYSVASTDGNKLTLVNRRG